VAAYADPYAARGQHRLFKQENPATDEEAFIGSGNPVFPGILVQRAIRAAEAAPAPVLGTLRAKGFVSKRSGSGTVDVPTGAVWVPAADAAAHEPLLRVWEHPVTEEEQALLPRDERKAAGQYVAGADFAEGTGNTIADGDYHAFVVWDHERKVQVAEHESRIDVQRVPLWLVLVGLYYNEAWLAPEINSLGMYVVEALKDYRYPRIYKPRRVGEAQERRTGKVGWQTTQVTKPLIEGTMAEALADDTHGVRSVKLARQMNTYVVDDRGRHGAQPGEHDDVLMAGMIGKHVAMELVPHRPRKRKGFHAEDPLTGYYALRGARLQRLRRGGAGLRNPPRRAGVGCACVRSAWRTSAAITFSSRPPSAQSTAWRCDGTAPSEEHTSGPARRRRCGRAASRTARSSGLPTRCSTMWRTRLRAPVTGRLIGWGREPDHPSARAAVGRPHLVRPARA
jgi:hypothetical protein